MIQFIQILLMPFVALNKWLNQYKIKKSKPIANSAAGAFEGRITRTLNSDIKSRGLLVKASSQLEHVELAQANDLPQGIALSAGYTGDAIAIALIGSTQSTLKMIAASTIPYGSLVYTANNGCIQTEPNTPGTYYCIGQSLNMATHAGAIVEVDPYSPSKLCIQ